MKTWLNFPFKASWSKNLLWSSTTNWSPCSILKVSKFNEVGFFATSRIVKTMYNIFKFISTCGKGQRTSSGIMTYCNWTKQQGRIIYPFFQQLTYQCTFAMASFANIVLDLIQLLSLMGQPEALTLFSLVVMPKTCSGPTKANSCSTHTSLKADQPGMGFYQSIPHSWKVSFVFYTTAQFSTIPF